MLEEAPTMNFGAVTSEKKKTPKLKFLCYMYEL